MRVDPDTSIHDLTDTEAADLRTLCEAMLRGPTLLDHPLFLAWSKASGLDEGQTVLAFTTAFLLRALHALLRRATCSTCGEPRTEPLTRRAMSCSNGFHVCRCCVREQGRLVRACPRHENKP